MANIGLFLNALSLQVRLAWLTLAPFALVISLPKAITLSAASLLLIISNRVFGIYQDNSHRKALWTWVSEQKNAKNLESSPEVLGFVTKFWLQEIERDGLPDLLNLTKDQHIEDRLIVLQDKEHLSFALPQVHFSEAFDLVVMLVPKWPPYDWGTFHIYHEVAHTTRLCSELRFFRSTNVFMLGVWLLTAWNLSVAQPVMIVLSIISVLMICCSTFWSTRLEEFYADLYGLCLLNAEDFRSVSESFGEFRTTPLRAGITVALASCFRKIREVPLRVKSVEALCRLLSPAALSFGIGFAIMVSGQNDKVGWDVIEMALLAFGFWKLRSKHILTGMCGTDYFYFQRFMTDPHFSSRLKSPIDRELSLIP